MFTSQTGLQYLDETIREDLLTAPRRQKECDESCCKLKRLKIKQLMEYRSNQNLELLEDSSFVQRSFQSPQVTPIAEMGKDESEDEAYLSVVCCFLQQATENGVPGQLCPSFMTPQLRQPVASDTEESSQVDETYESQHVFDAQNAVIEATLSADLNNSTFISDIPIESASQTTSNFPSRRASPILVRQSIRDLAKRYNGKNNRGLGQFNQGSYYRKF